MDAKENIKISIVKAFEEAFDCPRQPWRTIGCKDDDFLYEVIVSVQKYAIDKKEVSA